MARWQGRGWAATAGVMSLSVLCGSPRRLQWCGLSESCCAELAALLAEHPSLAQLELGDGTLGDGGVRLLCEGLQQPGCRLHVLR